MAEEEFFRRHDPMFTGRFKVNLLIRMFYLYDHGRARRGAIRLSDPTMGIPLILNLTLEHFFARVSLAQHQLHQHPASARQSRIRETCQRRPTRPSSR